MSTPHQSDEIPPAPERREGEPTTEFLARALTDLGAPEWMVSYARDGHYDDFKSPLAMPEHQLHTDARENGLPEVAAWVELGVFDSTREESAAWAQSPDGQATFRELMEGSSKNRAQMLALAIANTSTEEALGVARGWEDRYRGAVERVELLRVIADPERLEMADRVLRSIAHAPEVTE